MLKISARNCRFQILRKSSYPSARKVHGPTARQLEAAVPELLNWAVSGDRGRPAVALRKWKRFAVPTMPVEDIKAMPVGKIADSSASKIQILLGRAFFQTEPRGHLALKALEDKNLRLSAANRRR
jgi:hypothetical protein